MKKIKLITLLCLTLMITAACSNNNDGTTTKDSTPSKARSIKTTSTSTFESSSTVVDESMIELKTSSPFFNELMLDFLQKGLTVKYDGKVGAYEYTGENKNVDILGENGQRITFNPTPDTMLTITKFEDDTNFSAYVEALKGEGDGPELVVSSQYAINDEKKMTMQLVKEIDSDTFGTFKTIFESK